MNNPMRLIDRDGRDPGDPFKTPEAAAKDFAKIYNGISIVVGVELDSSIYIIETKSGKQYTYSSVAVGDKDGTKISLPPNGEAPVADIHSHGAWDEGYINNDFSPKDKKSNIKKGIDGYVTTPDGSLKKYDVKNRRTEVISEDLPSDPNDPDRKNDNLPISYKLENNDDETKRD